MPALPTRTVPKPTSKPTTGTPPTRASLPLRTRLQRTLSPLTSRTARRLTLLFLSMYASAALIRSYLLDYSRNEGLSMLPTIPAAHSRSIWSPLYAHGRGVKLGDIVQARHPLFPGMLVGKRVVGLPGDYVLRDESMAATAGGAWVVGYGDGVGNEKDGRGREREERREEPVMVQVPEGHVWLAGDNMAWSRDSRFYGPVPLALIKAKSLWHLTSWFDWEPVWREQVTKVEEPEQV